jgi:hypothetical protein
MEEKKLTGRIAREKIKLMQVPRPPQGAVEAFLALGDPTGIVADAMDELGIPCGVVGAHVLKPTIPGTVMVGPALKVRIRNHLCLSLQVSPPYSCRIVTNEIRCGADANHNKPHGVDIFAFAGNNQFQWDDNDERNESVSNAHQPSIPFRPGAALRN